MNKAQLKAIIHKDILGEGAKARKQLPCEQKMSVVMNEYKHGHLHSGNGEIVKNYKQAVAIGISEAKRCIHK